jgi:hypothetical protein
MAILKKQPRVGKIEIDITGSQGNAFVILGYARQYAKELGMDSKPIIEEMMSGDYENLLEVFDKNFGDYVDLLR